MSVRRPVLRTVLVAVAVLLASVLAGPLSSVTAQAAPSETRASGPVYGPWSTYYGDLRARVATPTKQRPRLRVQVNRTAAQTGDRQVRLTWRPAGQQTRSTRRRDVAPSATVTLVTAQLPCGRTRATLMGRGRAPGGAWGEWKSFGADITRPC